VLIASPTSIDERGEVASSCVRSLKIPFPALLDDLRNSTESAYNGWPDRLYVIGQDGCIAYKSRPGPFGFKPAEVAAVLSKIVRAEQQ
jgi:type I thyroxine 5'-deiodinase